MANRNNPPRKSLSAKQLSIPKAPTGITGLDEITEGGFPTGRPTLVSGSAGAGKTMLATEFLVRGATQFNEPGVFLMFEENSEELTANVRSLGFDLDKLSAEKKIVLDHVRIERSEIEETGEYDLEGLFIRLDHAIRSIGAKRVVLDTLEALFAGLPSHAILRAELRRLFRWLKERGITALVTGETGEASLTRYGLEEYVADCVITLDHRVTGQVSTRRLRVVKYRGSSHGTNEYPFLIGEHGLSVLPITSLRLDHAAPTERFPTGIDGLDQMLGGKGVFRGASILVSGSPGTGKSSIGASFVNAACRRGERAILFAYEESADQIVRNMRSIGLDLAPWIKKGLLQIHASRPTLQGLEQHLLAMHDLIADFNPSVVAVDPISNLTFVRDDIEVKPTLMRLIDHLKKHEITAVFTSLTSGANSTTAPEDSQVGVSSLMDVWLLLRNHEMNGERNRTIYVLKARGMSHSNQVREFLLNDSGISLVDVYIGTDGVLTGTSRVAQEARERSDAELRLQSHARKLRQLASKRKTIESQIAALQADLDVESAELDFSVAEEAARIENDRRNLDKMAIRRGSQLSAKDSLKKGKR
ncbi:circadian clock protein KaiC [Luteolibacter sp. GHJ8]|uniref:non-specific serine/threonine protein kinase n=1 Tax=Luteolibacter rhizosphaerae TaxID=2989719 RepID=A0ABT3FY06_9BACT|nr:circadian clock protein KaiC [Luteolibacter rhizosphaerae]MCW1912453.1 circadian clock protein KaiC [Luteolibacter rhizosphaerae]